MASVLEQLKIIRSFAGDHRTVGLDDDTVCRFVQHDESLIEAVNAAAEEFEALRREYPELMALGETEQVEAIEGHLVNFYADDAVNPHVSMAALGPWVLTPPGAVLPDHGASGPVRAWARRGCWPGAASAASWAGRGWRRRRRCRR